MCWKHTESPNSKTGICTHNTDHCKPESVHPHLLYRPSLHEQLLVGNLSLKSLNKVCMSPTKPTCFSFVGVP